VKGKFVIVSAPSGAGKTTIVRRLMQAGLNLEFSISAASRAPRANEINGKDYFFMSIEDFREKISNGDLLEWQEVYKENYYGTLKREVERIWNRGHHVLFDVDVQGGINLKKLFPDITLAIFIMPPSLEELGKRLRMRSTETADNIARRLEKARTEITFSDKFDKVITNDDLEKAVSEAIQAVSQFLTP
jgi:guanylate kinase